MVFCTDLGSYYLDFMEFFPQLIEYVENKILDGNYILNLQIASFENDASPSKPILYKIC